MELFAQPVVHGIVAVKANPTGQLSEDTEKMARRRFQDRSGRLRRSRLRFCGR